MKKKFAHTIERSQLYVDGKLVKASVFAQMLMTHSVLKHCFAIGDNLYVYSEDLGIYRKFHKEEFHTLLLQELVRMDLTPFINKHYIIDTAWFILTSKRGNMKDISYEYLTFANGVLNLRTMELVNYSPLIVSLTRINVDYNKVSKPIEFEKLMDLNFEKDVQLFLKAFLRSALLGENKAQVFLYIVGPGGTGKSTLVNVFSMIVGSEATLTTTFRDLNQDRFEGLNLIGKRLICINDTESFQGDLSILKAITGGDSIQGREKHISGSIEVIPRGLLIVTGNTPLQTRDASGAISRRMRMVPMESKPLIENQKPLIYKIDGEWSGPLVQESPGIINWAYMDSSQAYNLLVNPKLTPSLFKAQEEALQIINPLSEWIKELHIGSTEKAYIGFLPGKSDLQSLITHVKFKKTLYPCYLVFCLKRSSKPLSHVRFSTDLLMSCKSRNIEVSKGKDRYGVFIIGLSVDITQMEEIHGAPLNTEALTGPTAVLLEGSTEANPIKEIIVQSKAQNALQWQTRNPQLYKEYYKALESNKAKASLNELAKKFNPKVSTLLKEHKGLLSGLEGIQVEGLDYDFGKPSQAYMDKTADILNKGIKKIQTQLIPFKYKPMGLSPRILPQGYGESFNSVKRLLREKAYKFISKKVLTPKVKDQLRGEKDFVILDVDLKSCYTSVLLGLFPEEMLSIRQALEGPGLWKYIEEEFIRSNRKSLFNKPAVKICVYSSFFGGGPKAMVQGTLEFMRKDIGLNPDEFRKAEYYEALHALARDVSEFMNSTEVIKNFRGVSRIISRNYDGEFIKGPTSHEFIIDQQQLQTSYPNFLQSFEFYLLAQATLNTIPHFEAHLIHHFHDGNVVYLPKSQVENYITFLNEQLEELRLELGLAYPQIIEHKVY